MSLCSSGGLDENCAGCGPLRSVKSSLSWMPTAWDSSVLVWRSLAWTNSFKEVSLKEVDAHRDFLSRFWLSQDPSIQGNVSSVQFHIILKFLYIQLQMRKIKYN